MLRNPSRTVLNKNQPPTAVLALKSVHQPVTVNGLRNDKLRRNRALPPTPSVPPFVCKPRSLGKPGDNGAELFGEIGIDAGQI